MGDVPHPHPHSHSGSCPQSKSLDRNTRSPSQHRSERQVTFQELEVEPKNRGSREYSPRTPTQGWDAVHPERCWTLVEGVVIHLSHQLKMWKFGWTGKPTRWTPLLVEGTYFHPWGRWPEEAGPKNQDLFSIPAVRCETFPDQGYNVPLSPSAAPGVDSFWMIWPVRTSSDSPCWWWWHMPEHYNIR